MNFLVRHSSLYKYNIRSVIILWCLCRNNMLIARFNEVEISQSLETKGIRGSKQTGGASVSAGVSINFKIQYKLLLYIPLKEEDRSKGKVIVDFILEVGSTGENNSGATTSANKSFAAPFTAEHNIILIPLDFSIKNIPELSAFIEYIPRLKINLQDWESELKKEQTTFTKDLQWSLFFLKTVGDGLGSFDVSVEFALPKETVVAKVRQVNSVPSSDTVTDAVEVSQNQNRANAGNSAEKSDNENTEGYNMHRILVYAVISFLLIVIFYLVIRMNNVGNKSGLGMPGDPGFTKTVSEEKTGLKEAVILRTP